MADGIGCTCYARCEGECACGVDWTSQTEIDLRNRVAELEQICRNAYEVYAGSEGIPMPETAPEAYLLKLVHDMKDEIAKGLK